MKFTKGKLKAVTFSYDDGIEQDRRLVELFNFYGLKCTFNLNTGIQSRDSFWVDNDIHIHRMDKDGLNELYKGHEIASHSLNHPPLTDLTLEQAEFEMKTDIENISELFNEIPAGMAYPYGVYNDEVVGMLQKLGIKYARTVKETNSFEPQSDLLRFNPTCHHGNENLFQLADEFLSLKPDTPKIFYIWGHSYEFDVKNNWDRIEKFCRLISGKEDIFYGTNKEVLL